MTDPSNFDLSEKHRLVIKIGSSLLVDPDQGLRHTWLNSLADDIQKLRDQSKEVIIVSSGAIALGRQILNLQQRRLRLDESQAAAAVGQIELGRVYRQVLEQRGLVCGQILVTLDDTEQRQRYLNARATLQSLLKIGVVPVVNENDTVATNEIRYGDNDRLSARVAIMASADGLIILSDVDGLFTGPPESSDSELVSRVDSITPEIENMAGGSSSTMGSGGMITKIQAAKLAVNAGTEMVITNGTVLNPVSQLSKGRPFTRFVTHDNPISARKKWIASDLIQTGWIRIDAGASMAIQSNRSLLPIGVTEVHGNFERGDVVEIRSNNDRVVARGITNYETNEARLIMGHKADQIKSLLGYDGPENLVHRDDMVIFDSQKESNE